MKYVKAMIFLFGSCFVVHASVITFATPEGSTAGGQPVDATVTFTTTDTSVSIVLTNLEANPTSVIQNLSDLEFTFSQDVFPSAIGGSDSAQAVTVHSDGTFTLGSTSSTGWGLSAPNHHAVLLNVLGTPTGPAHTIVGPPGPGNLYSNANGSIAGNGPHNPFLNQTADFTITFPLPLLSGVTVTSATFSFGTTAGNDVSGVPVTTVPEPSFSGAVALGLGILLIAVGRRGKSLLSRSWRLCPLSPSEPTSR
jgi:hypothetical protein